VDAVNERDFERVSEFAGGRIAEEAERWIGPFTESFPDFRMEVVDVIAEGDRVVGHLRCSGTHEGEWRGRSPTGRRFEGVDEIYVFVVRDGKLAEATAVIEDNLTRLQQLGLLD
jgi:predicted ester cyclase